MSTSTSILGLLGDINESLGDPLPYKYESISERRAGGSFKVEGKDYMVFFQLKKDMVTWSIDFVDSKFRTTKTGEGDQFKVFSTVIAIIKEFIDDRSPERMNMEASKTEGESRSSLYKKLLQKYARGWGYKFEEESDSTYSSFTLYK